MASIVEDEDWEAQFSNFVKQIDASVAETDITKKSILGCLHETVREDTDRACLICISCGLEIPSLLCATSSIGFRTHHQIRHRTRASSKSTANSEENRSLFNDVRNIPGICIPEEAIELANIMFAHAAPRDRPLNPKDRKKRVIACLFEALKKLHLDFDNDILLKVSDLERKHVMKAVKTLILSGASTKATNYMSSHGLCDEYMASRETLDTNSLVNDLVFKVKQNITLEERRDIEQVTRRFIRSAKESSIDANRARPRSLAAAMLFLAMKDEFPLPVFCEKIGISEYTLGRILRDVHV